MTVPTPKSTITDRPTAVIYVRLSRDRDESTSVESQRALCEEYAARMGWRVIAVFEDIDVSGATRLEDRPGMSRVLDLLTTRQVHYVLAWKLDRFARSMIEFGRFMAALSFAGAEGITTDGVLSPGGSGTVGKIMAAVAEIERDMIVARVVTAKDRLRKQGRWPGGKAPYGYRIVKRNGGAYLDIDPETGPRVREMVRRVIAGTRIETLVNELNTTGVLAPSAYARVQQGRPPESPRTGKLPKWTATVLKDLLMSPTLTGTLMHDPRPQNEKRDANGRRIKARAADLRPVLDADGRVVKVGPPLISEADHIRVREVLESRSVPMGARATDTLLLHIAYCAGCGGPLYANARKDRPSNAYRCTNRHCTARAFIGDTIIEPYVASTVLAAIGEYRPMVKAAEIADVSAEIARDRAAIRSLSEALATLPAGSPAWQGVMAQLTATNQRLTRLEKQQERAGEATWVPAQTTWAEDWHAAPDDSARRALLRMAGVRVTVRKAAPGLTVSDRITVEITDPHVLAAVDTVDAIAAEETTLTTPAADAARDAASVRGIRLRVDTAA